MFRYEVETVVKVEGLQKFLNDQMRERGMSLSEFAKFVGISKSTMSRTLNEQNPTVPDWEVLAKIADATGVDFLSLVALIMPANAEIDAEARIMAQKIMRLSEIDRRHILAQITGLLIQSNAVKD